MTVQDIKFCDPISDCEDTNFGPWVGTGSYEPMQRYVRTTTRKSWIVLRIDVKNVTLADIDCPYGTRGRVPTHQHRERYQASAARIPR